MSNTQKITCANFSDLEKKLLLLKELKSQHLNICFEITDLEHQIRTAKQLALIEAKVYSGIKKYLK